MSINGFRNEITFAALFQLIFVHAFTEPDRVSTTNNFRCVTVSQPSSDDINIAQRDYFHRQHVLRMNNRSHLLLCPRPLLLSLLLWTKHVAFNTVLRLTMTMVGVLEKDDYVVHAKVGATSFIPANGASFVHSRTDGNFHRDTVWPQSIVVYYSHANRMYLCLSIVCLYPSTTRTDEDCDVYFVGFCVA